MQAQQRLAILRRPDDVAVAEKGVAERTECFGLRSGIRDRFVADGLPEATVGAILICGLLLTRSRQTKVGAIHR